MGVHWPVAPRFGREGDHQLNGIALALGLRLPSSAGPYPLSTVWPRQTGRHHRRPQRQIELAGCRAAGGRSQGTVRWGP